MHKLNIFIFYVTYYYSNIILVLMNWCVVDNMVVVGMTHCTKDGNPKQIQVLQAVKV